MNFSTIISYLFSAYPGTPEKTFWYLLVGIVLSHILAGALAIYLRRRDDGYARKLSRKLLFWSVISLVVILMLVSFRYQNIYGLSMRAFLIVWLALALAWLANIGWWWLRSVPAARQRKQERREYDRYLPKRK